MRTTFLILLIAFMQVPFFALSQTKANDIPLLDLPANVKQTLDKYVEILNLSSIDDCANKFIEIAGGGLVNESGTALRNDIKTYSLKKDHDYIKFYKQPVEITRVNKTPSNGQGFGASTIKGQVYKIWIAKKTGGAGMPAPVSIMVPEGHATITTPKVVNIGSF
jgi:hypothetical protein